MFRSFYVWCYCHCRPVWLSADISLFDVVMCSDHVNVCLCEIYDICVT